MTQRNFGLHDNTDLSHVTWSRRGYDVAELENLYTGNHARAGLMAQTIQDTVADPLRMRALGFCVSIAHAEFMAREFHRIGLPSAAVSSQSTREERDGCPAEAAEPRRQRAVRRGPLQRGSGSRWRAPPCSCSSLGVASGRPS